MFDAPLNADTSLCAGQYLLSEPFLTDPNFQRAAILLCEHEEERGSFGLVLNQPTSLKVGDVIEIPGGEDQRLYTGGPVAHNSLHFLHKFPDITGAQALGGDLFWGGNFNELRQKALFGKISEENTRFFVGYTGWDTGQLADEVAESTWVIARIPAGEYFRHTPENLWTTLMKQLGGQYRIMAGFPNDPRLN